MSVRQGLLSLLDRAPMHGYQLRQEFEAATGSTWPLNVGQVYTTLARLERDGLVTPRVEDGATAEAQHVYEITPAGRQAVAGWFASPVDENPARDELAIKLALAATTPGLDVLAVVQIQRGATMRRLQNYTRARERAGDDLPWLLVTDSLIFAAEAQIRWLDHCEMTLARAARQSRKASTVDTTTAPIETEVVR